MTVRRPVGWLVLAVGAGWNLLLLAAAHGNVAFGLELRGNLYEPGQRILHGQNPYDLAHTERALHDPTVDCCLQALYPAATHVLFAPLAWLPFDAAMVLFTVVAVGALVGGLWLLDVRDPAAFGVVLLLPPVWHGLKLGGIMPFLILGLAVAWRWRDRPWVAGVAVAVTAVLKVFLWPVWLWLVFTRRYRAAVIAAVSALVMLTVGWAVIGFDGLRDYPRLLRNLTEIEGGEGVSLYRLGGYPLAVAAFTVLIVAAWRWRSLPLTVVAAVALTPVVWVQTLSVLLVPAVLGYRTSRRRYTSGQPAATSSRSSPTSRPDSAHARASSGISPASRASS